MILFLRLREAVTSEPATNDADQTARVVIITEGLGNLRDRNYYAKTAVQSCADVFNGKQFYIDHPSKVDEENRPERSVRDLAGYFSDTQVGSIPDQESGENLAACFATLNFAESEPGRLAYAQVKTALKYQKKFPNEKDVFCGISINGGGVSHPDKISGMPVNMVTEIKEAFSADIVTKPARGGKFIAMMQEAQKLAKHLRRDKAREAGARVSKGDGMEKLNEARKEVAAEAKKRMMSGDGLKGIGDKMSKLVAAINKPPDDPDDLIKDIQMDLDALDSLLHDLKQVKKQQAEAKRTAAEEEKMAKREDERRGREDERRGREDEKRGREDEKHEDEKREDERYERREDEKHEDEKREDERREDEMGFGDVARDPGDDVKNKHDNESEDDDEAGYGMRADEDEDDDDDDDLAGVVDAGDPSGAKDPHDDSVSVGKHEMVPKAASEREARMKYQCEACEHENEVLPPKGYKLARTDEQYSTESQKLGQLVTRLRRALESKEARFMQANSDKRNLMQENIKLRARVTAFERMVEAKKVLKEAGIPRDILSAMDLLAFEPHQWSTQIKAAKRVLENESKLIRRGGRGPVDGGAAKDSGGADAVSTFREAYKK